MKTIQVNKYQCEICEMIYDDIGLAKECEAQGKPNILDDIFVTDQIVTLIGDTLAIATISKITHYGIQVNVPKIIKPVLIIEFYHIPSNKVIKMELPPLAYKMINLYYNVEP